MRYTYLTCDTPTVRRLISETFDSLPTPPPQMINKRDTGRLCDTLAI